MGNGCSQQVAAAHFLNGFSEKLAFGEVVANDAESAVKVEAGGKVAAPPCVLVLDNKGHHDPKECPRLAVVVGGVATPVTAGDASVITASDLESVCLVDAEKGLYVAVESQCKTHVFTLAKDGSGGYMAGQVATGQLPVPEGEDIASWQDPHPANVEAARVVLGDDHPPVMVWGARGGFNYAGSGTASDSVWLRAAPFNIDGTVDEQFIKTSTLKNLGATGSWRALSCVDFDPATATLFFAAAYDGEEDGKPLHKKDRDHWKNKLSFKSLVASVDVASGAARVLGRFSGIKVESLMRDAATGNFVLVTDDEGLGSLVSVVAPTENGTFPAEVAFADLATASTAAGGGEVAVKRWGSSGVAPLAAARAP